MNRIRTFGCSLTSYHKWQYLVKNHPFDGRNSDPEEDSSWHDGEMKHPPVEWTHERHRICEWTHDGIHLTDYSMAGWGNDVQHIQYANEVYYKNISKDDIIIWQLTSPYRIAIRHMGILGTGELKFQNVFNGEEMFMDTLTEPDAKDIHSPFLKATTYNTLWQLNGIKRNNDKLLVLFGWDACWINKGFSEKKEIINFLKEHDIDYIEESILGWSTRHKFFKEDITALHPPQEGYKSFTEDCLLPKLNKLKWLD